MSRVSDNEMSPLNSEDEEGGASEEEDHRHHFGRHEKCLIWPPLAETRRKAKDDNFKGLWAVKWCGPAFCFCVSTFTCMWFLHVGTFYYVHLMERQESVYKVLPPNSPNMTKFKYPFLSPGLDPAVAGTVSFGSLEDPPEAALGWTPVDMHVLDMVSATLPATWFVTTILTDDLQHWTKMIICNCFLAVLKGLFSFMTVVPDSMGWHHCKARLAKSDGIKRMKEDIANPEEGFLAVFWSTLTFEIKNLFGKFTGQPNVRFCADMMFSGHTYFTTLYALGLSELVRKHTAWMPDKTFFNKRFWIVSVVYMLCVIEQVVEISLVLQNRFHYTMDVVMAIILTFLFFTNGSVGIAAKSWTYWNGDPTHLASRDAKMPESAKNVAKELNSSEEGKQILKWVSKNKEDWILMPTAYFRDHGDTWTPPCCFPFCCFWGPRHMFDHGSERMVRRILKEREEGEDSEVGSEV